MVNSIGVRNALGRLRHYGPYLPAVNYRGRRIHGHGNKRHVIGNKGRKIYKFHYVKPVRARKAREVLNSIAIPGATIGVALGGGRMRHYGPKTMPKTNYRGRTIHKTRTGRLYVLGPKGSRVYAVHFSKPERAPRMAKSHAKGNWGPMTSLKINKGPVLVSQMHGKAAIRSPVKVLSPLRTPGGREPVLNLFASPAKAAKVLSPLRTPGGRVPTLNLFASPMKKSPNVAYIPKREGPMIITSVPRSPPKNVTVASGVLMAHPLR